MHIHSDANDLWNHILLTKLLSTRGRKRNEGILKSSTGRAIILYEQHHTRQCINTTSIIYQYHTHTHTHTHAHTHTNRMFGYNF